VIDTTDLSSIATAALASQYDAGLSNLREAIEVCPDRAWNSAEDENRFWHIAYHVLFFTDLYMTVREEEYRPWPEGRREAVPLGENPFDPEAEFDDSDDYSREQLLGYLEEVRGRIDEELAGHDLSGPSGFSWLPMSRLEAHIYNIRHLQHHTAQLVDRMREREGVHVAWVGMRG
jgi:hypothetical protein